MVLALGINTIQSHFDLLLRTLHPCHRPELHTMESYKQQAESHEGYAIDGSQDTAAFITQA